MSRSNDPAAFTDEFRRLIRESGKTPRAIARDSGGAVDPSQVYRFITGKRGLSMASLDAIAKQLGIRPTVVT